LTRLVVVVTMLALIDEYDHNPAGILIISLRTFRIFRVKKSGGWNLLILRYATECSDMDLNDKEYPEIESHSI